VPRALIALALLSGCTARVSLGSDDPRTYPDGATIVHCGPLDCEPGKVCCNAACGVCAALGACPAVNVACPDASAPCSADHVVISGETSCTRWVWNGLDCVSSQGCVCSGDCGVTGDSYVACMGNHEACWSQQCGASTPCPHDFFCARACGAASGLCTPSPTDGCATAPHLAACGCDGIAYTSSCRAQLAGQSLLTTPTCGACNPPAVTFTAGCTTTIGWSWDGQQCVAQTGCACAGACDRLEPTESACLRRYAAACAPVFPCGTASCRLHTELCLLGPSAGICIPMPAGCSDCACILGGDLGAVDCSDDGAGRVVALTSA
jgi:hypothetical protein